MSNPHDATQSTPSSKEDWVTVSAVELRLDAHRAAAPSTFAIDRSSLLVAATREEVEAAPWRKILRQLAGRNSPFNEMTPRTLARMLERHGTGCHAPLSAEEMLHLIEEGKGELVATRAALAFTIDHGAHVGIELRYLLVIPRHRRRGAGRALVAKLRARYAGASMFCTFSDSQWTRFARLAGFEAQQQLDGNWLVTSDMAPLTGGTVSARSARHAGRPSTGAPGATRTHDTPDQRDGDSGRVRRLIKALCASAAVAAATVSCIEL
jgi:hypothetical protein